MKESEVETAPAMASLLSATYHSIIERIEVNLSSAGHHRLTGKQLYLLISIPKQGIEIFRLANRSGISRHLLENLVQGAVAADYMHRNGDQLGLTSAGRDALVIVKDTERAVEREWREFIGDASYGELRKLLSRLFEKVT